MKTATKIFATGLLFSACSWATAAPILSIGGTGDQASAVTAETAFLASLQGDFKFEDFESFPVATDVSGQTTSPLNTNVGTFQTKSTDLGSGGACDTGGFQCVGGLAILDNNVSPFTGRFAVSPDNWLDSMDAKTLTISPESGYNAIGFFMTDPNDSGGRFEIAGVSFDFGKIFGDVSLPNGQVYYISILDAGATTLADVSIFSNATGDGYGIDNVTVGKVPEPGTLALLGLGLAGLGIARRRKQA